MVRAPRAGNRDASEQAVRAEDLEDRIGDIARIQAETAGRVKTMGEVLAGRQAELARLVNERLDAMTGRIGQSMTDTTAQTVERLQRLHERLAVIDSAQKNITDLSQQVTSLRDVLSNKQTRGAFGQATDGEPSSAIACRRAATSSSSRFPTGTRPDCVIMLPDGRPLVIDAKFPLEACHGVARSGNGETSQAGGAAHSR